MRSGQRKLTPPSRNAAKNTTAETYWEDCFGVDFYCLAAVPQVRSLRLFSIERAPVLVFD